MSLDAWKQQLATETPERVVEHCAFCVTLNGPGRDANGFCATAYKDAVQGELVKRKIIRDKYAQGIRGGEVRLGYTPDELRCARGTPRDINRSVGRYGVREQWVYRAQNFYFEDGVLSSWQD